jgi:hypothetical protein
MMQNSQSPVIRIFSHDVDPLGMGSSGGHHVDVAYSDAHAVALHGVDGIGEAGQTVRAALMMAAEGALIVQVNAAEAEGRLDAPVQERDQDTAAERDEVGGSGSESGSGAGEVAPVIGVEGGLKCQVGLDVAGVAVGEVDADEGSGVEGGEAGGDSASDADGDAAGEKILGREGQG